MQRLKCDIGRALQQATSSILVRRCYSTQRRNYYHVLGLERSATSNDIKGAYYKLSKLFHPDKNLNNDEAAQKFREITEAYEVLGNFRLRKLYDKGIIHTAGDNYHRQEEPPEEDDPQTKFYKARMHKERRTATGRTPIYDFDEWTNAHYGGEFKRRQKLKKDSADRVLRKESGRRSIERELLLIAIMFVFLMVALGNKDRDVDRVSERKRSEEKK